MACTSAFRIPQILTSATVSEQFQVRANKWGARYPPRPPQDDAPAASHAYGKSDGPRLQSSRASSSYTDRWGGNRGESDAEPMWWILMGRRWYRRTDWEWAKPRENVSRDRRLDGDATSGSPPDGAFSHDIHRVSAFWSEGKIVASNRTNAEETLHYAKFAFVLKNKFPRSSRRLFHSGYNLS